MNGPRIVSYRMRLFNDVAVELAQDSVLGKGDPLGRIAMSQNNSFTKLFLRLQQITVNALRGYVLRDKRTE